MHDKSYVNLYFRIAVLYNLFEAISMVHLSWHDSLFDTNRKSSFS